MAAKPSLARFTARIEGEHFTMVRDDCSTLPGRGLYVCFKRACFERARARGAFARGARVPAGHLAVDVGLADGLEGEE